VCTGSGTPLPTNARRRAPLRWTNWRSAALEAELAELAYVEEAVVVAALAKGQDVQRSALAPPAAVLGVRVAETKATRAA
jgi:hypothetical protein